MRRKSKIWVSMVMIISICLEIVLSNIGTTTIIASETLPFEFENTDYGVVDSNVVAKKLKITRDNVKIVDAVYPDMLLLKEQTESGKVKIYVVGIKGLIHTFEVEADSEWLNHLADTYRDQYQIEENRDFIPVTYYTGARSRDYGYGLYQPCNPEQCQYEDSMMAVKNPVTGKFDLMNLTTGKYFEYGFDKINAVPDDKYGKFEYDVNFIPYVKDEKCGFLDKHGEKLTEARFIGCYKNDAGVLICDMEDDQKGYVTKDGKFDGSTEFLGGKVIDNCAYVQKSDKTWCFVDFKTGEIRENKSEKDKPYRGVVKGFNETDTIAISDDYGYNSDYDMGLDKSYYMTAEGTIDLNEKLGGEYCSISNGTKYGPELITEEEYLYAEAYSVVKNKDGKWDKEYSYRGYIDGKGNKVYGTDSPDDEMVKFCYFTGDYGLILDTPVSVEIDGCRAMYMTLKAVNRNGGVYYQIPAGIQVGGYEQPVIRYIDNVYVTKDYFSFHLKKDDKTVLIDGKTGKATEYQAKFIELDEKWIVNGEQYALINYGTYTELKNLVTGNSCQLGITSITNKDFVVSEDGRALILVDYFDEDDDEYNDLLLNEKLETVYKETKLSNDDNIDYIGNDMYFATDKSIFDYSGKEVLRCEEGSQISKMYDSEHDVKQKNYPIYQMYNGSYKRKYTFFNKKGELLSEYQYDAVSYFKNGLAYTYIEDYQGDYIGEYCSIINCYGNAVVEGKFSNRFISGDSDYSYDAMNGQGIILLNDAYYFYDFDNVTMEDISEEQAVYNKEEKEYREKRRTNALPVLNMKLDGLNQKFTLPDEVPVIGGEKISLNLGMVPIICETSDKEFRIGIGVELESKGGEKNSLFDLEKKEWNGFKKCIEKQNKDLLKGKKLYLDAKSGEASLPAKTSVEAKVFGYAEGTMDNGKIKAIDGKINIELSYSVGKKWQTVVVSVPVIISAKVEAGVEAQYKLGMDFEKSSLFVDGNLELTMPKVKLSAGVGIAYIADISVYGEVKNILEISYNGGNDRVRDYIDGEMGVSASVLCASYKKVLWPGKKKIVYDSANGMVTSSIKKQNKISENDFSMERVSSKKWMKKATVTDDTDNIDILQKGVYSQANPKIIATDNGTKIMVYTADDATRTTGNHTVIMYSVYDTKTQNWQKPQYVEDDGTADFYPDVATDGKDIFVTWVNTKSNQFTENSSISEIAKDCEISVAKFDPDTNSFKEITRLTENNYVDVRPSLLIKDGDAYVVWISNSENDLLNLKGTNQIHYAKYSGNMWKEKDVVYASEEKPVCLVKAGLIENAPIITYTLDQDGDIQSGEDSAIYAGNLNGEIKQIFTEKKGVKGIDFVTLSDGRQIAYFSAEDGLWYSSDLETAKCLLEGKTSEYQIVNGENSDFIIGSEASDKGTNVSGYIWKNGEISQPVSLTNQNQYIQNPNGFYENGTYYLAFTKANMSLNETEFQVSTDICTMQFKTYSDIALDNVKVDEETVVPGQKTEAQVTLNNNGLEQVDSFEVQIKYDGAVIGKKTFMDKLQIGEKKTVVVDIQIPDEFHAGENIECQVMNQSTDDLDNSNNKMELKTGNPDLELSVFPKEEEEGTSASVYVSNVSGFDTNAKIVIHDTDKSGKEIFTMDLGVVKAGELRNVILSKEELAKISSPGTSLYVEVVSAEEEVLSNNYGFIFMEDSSAVENIPSMEPTPTNSPTPTIQVTATPKVTPKPVPTLIPTPKPITIKVTKPAKVKLKSVKAIGKKKLKVTWKWDAGLSGYQVQYALNKSFTKGKKTKNAGKYDEVKTLTGLKSKKYYYVRVRAYKKSGSKTVYGSWSTVKKCKVK